MMGGQSADQGFGVDAAEKQGTSINTAGRGTSENKE